MNKVLLSWQKQSIKTRLI
ncbi:hypothetical protein ACLNAR_03385 [Priestia aryabhattai]